MEVAIIKYGFTAVGSVLNTISLLHLTSFRYPSQASVKDGDSFDYIVVGGGSAGCVLANRLTEDPKTTVLLIEAGEDPPIESNIPSFLSLTRVPPFDWNYTTAECNYECREGNIDFLSRGKLLGGSSSINVMFYVRGDRHDYDTWARITGDETWNYENVLPYFIKSETVKDPLLLNAPTGVQRGKNGPLKITYTKSSNIQKILGALKELGNDINVDTNGNVTLGYENAQVTVADNIRQSTANNYLSMAKNRRNLKVLKNHLATKINLKNKVAYSVETIDKKGKRKTFVAKKEIILSAGAINSPQLLMLSGIGPKEHLEDLDIEVVADLPVGMQMQDHKLVTLAYTMGPPRPRPTELKIPNLFEYPYPSMVGYGRLDKSQPYADYQIMSYLMPALHFLAACASFFRFNADICAAMHKKSRGRNILFIYHVNLHPKSRGRVLLKSTNPMEYPIIHTDPYENKEDLEDEVKYLQDFNQVVNTTYFKSVGSELVQLDKCAVLGAGSAEYWRCYAQCLVSTVWHYSGTCAMGAVLDSRLRVRGVSNLRVADASVMPTIPGGNTNAPTIMIAEKAADIIKKDNE